MSSKFLYPELNPKERFVKILEEYVEPLLQDDGFKLYKSGPSLKKSESGFEWIVEFDGRKWNGGNHICRFNPYFIVRNSNYRKYLKGNVELIHGYGTTGQIGTTAGIQHWDKGIFSTDGKEAYFLEDNDFAKHDNHQLVDDMIKNIRTAGIPFFRMMSEFDSIRNFHISLNLLGDAPKLIDLCYVLDRQEEVKPILDWYYQNNQSCSERINDQMDIRKNNWLQQNLKTT